jgi:hypothetical protein
MPLLSSLGYAYEPEFINAIPFIGSFLGSFLYFIQLYGCGRRTAALYDSLIR